MNFYFHNKLYSRFLCWWEINRKKFKWGIWHSPPTRRQYFPDTEAPVGWLCTPAWLKSSPPSYTCCVCSDVWWVAWEIGVNNFFLLNSPLFKLLWNTIKKVIFKNCSDDRLVYFSIEKSYAVSSRLWQLNSKNTSLNICKLKTLLEELIWQTRVTSLTWRLIPCDLFLVLKTNHLHIITIPKVVKLIKYLYKIILYHYLLCTYYLLYTILINWLQLGGGAKRRLRGGSWIGIGVSASEYIIRRYFVILRSCLSYFAVRREAGRRKRPGPRTRRQRIRRQINSDDTAATAHALTIPPLERTFAHRTGKYIIM